MQDHLSAFVLALCLACLLMLAWSWAGVAGVVGAVVGGVAGVALAEWRCRHEGYYRDEGDGE